MSDDVGMTTGDDDARLFILERICRCQKARVKNDFSMAPRSPSLSPLNE